MTIIRPDSLPRLWWLFPWSIARQLHKNAVALRELCDRQDDVIRSKASHRPRWSIWMVGHPGPDRRYLFVDNDGQVEKHLQGIKFGTKIHSSEGGVTSFNDADEAIAFCEDLNKKERNK
jgi:hypothetical protein